MRINHKLEKLLAEHAAIIAETNRELAMNFDVPALSIIGMACREMKISKSVWDDLQSYRIAKDEANEQAY